VPQIAKAYGTRWYMIMTDNAEALAMLQAGTSTLKIGEARWFGGMTTAFKATNFTITLREAREANWATEASPVWRSPRRCSPARSATS